jgi:hypothetical protein
MIPTLARKKRRHVEDQIQAAVVQHLELRGQPGLVWWHTPNGSKLGGARTKDGIPLAAIRGKKLGLKSGVSDLVFLHRGKFYALELKGPSGSPSDAQSGFIEAVIAAGGLACWSNSLDGALTALENWGLLRPSKGRQEAA